MEGSNWFNGISDAEVIPKTAAIVVALAKDPSLYQAVMSSIPTQEELTECHERHQASYNASMGDPTKALEHQAERQHLNGKFSVFVSVVKLAAAHDQTLLGKFGLTPPRPRKSSAPAALPMVENVRPRHGEKHGDIFLKCSPVKNAKSYDIEICEGDPSIEGNWRHAAVSVSASKMLVTGLTPGKVYWFRVRGIGANGAGPWSQYASLMAI
jgi:hypothetical protein